MFEPGAMPRQVAPLAASDPRCIGSYQPVGRLGMGGMGVVYLAVSQEDRRVALKVVRSELADEPQFRVRFAREVQAARAVGGQYTAHLVDADTEATPQWIATEYIPGPTLAEHVESHGAMPEDQVRLLGLGLAEAIEAIHAAGLIHRDLKPSNVILSAEGPKVIDFGISQAVDATSLTQTGVYVGSLAWMSPEQVTGDALSPTTDMFSLGLLLAYAALGRHPYGEGRPEAVAFRMVNQAPDLSDVPPSLRAPCGRLLSKTPNDRPSPEAVVHALTNGATQIHDITRVMDIRWDGTVAGNRPTLPPVPDANPAAPAPPRKRRRGLAVALAGTTTVAAATAAAVALGAIPLPTGGDVTDADAAAIASPSAEVEPGEEREQAAVENSTPTSTDQPNDTPDRYPLLVDSTLTVRSGPYLDAEAIGQLSANDTVLIECTADGDPVAGPDGTKPRWNQIAAPIEGWVSDAFVDTGTARSLLACQDIPTREASVPPNDDPAWPDLTDADDYASSFANRASPEDTTPPDFPSEVVGYRLASTETLTSRAFTGSLNQVYEVVATMNGCANQRFYLRWRTLNQEMSVKAVWTYPRLLDAKGELAEPVVEEQGGSAMGKSGWMSSYGCTIPAFEVADHPYSGPGEPLTDVVVELRIWTPSV